MVLALIVVGAAALAVFWLVQFVQLMLLEDEYFPGPLDKLVWGAAFVVLPPLAPFAFLMWKGARTGERQAPRAE